MLDLRHCWLPLALSPPLASCSDHAAELECVRARLLDISPEHITKTGRTLYDLGDWWIGQIEPDGSRTTVMQLDVDLESVDYLSSIDHDPESGRMWLLAWSHNELPAWLFQFDATGQVEWAEQLTELGGPIRHGALLHHQDALVVALAVEEMWPPNLVVQRRDLAGAVVWTRDNLPTPDGDFVFATGIPIGVADGALAMIATPPLIDYGPSYPLTLDFASGEPLWFGVDEDGHDPLRMVVDDRRLYLAWTFGPLFDPELWPETVVELEPASSSVQVRTPDGEAQAQSDIEWPEGWRRYDNHDIALAWMGNRLISLVEGSDGLGITVHDKQGELECQANLGLDIVALEGWAIGIEGREQALARVSVQTDELDEYGQPATEPRVLLLEPL